MMKKLMRRVQWLWALPLTLPGLVLWIWLLLKDGRMFTRRVGLSGSPVFYAFGPSCKRLLQLYPFFHAQAVTLGCVILAADEAALRDSFTHELVHVEQSLRWGLIFPVLYAGASAVAWLRGHSPYRHNIFEREAFDVEAMAKDRRQKAQNHQHNSSHWAYQVRKRQSMLNRVSMISSV